MSGWGCCPLACWRGHVCVRRVVVSPSFFTHVPPSFSCPNAWIHSAMFPILWVWCSPSDVLFSYNHCCHPIFFFLIFTFFFSCSHNEGVVTNMNEVTSLCII
jgi:hypothetical protein